MAPVALAFSTLVSRQVVVQSQADLISAAFKDVQRVAESNLDGYAVGALSAADGTVAGILTSPVNSTAANSDFSKTNYNTVDLSSCCHQRKAVEHG
jgi:hypothetical protein